MVCRSLIVTAFVFYRTINAPQITFRNAALLFWKVTLAKFGSSALRITGGTLVSAAAAVENLSITKSNLNTVQLPGARMAKHYYGKTSFPYFRLYGLLFSDLL